MTTKRSRILLADDHPVIVEAFQALLSPQMNVVGIFFDGRTLVEKAPKLEPDVAVLDIAMPMLNGLEAGRQLRKSVPNIKLIYLTMNEDPEIASEAMRNGASSYLLKKSAAKELFNAIDAAREDRQFITPVIEKAMKELWVRNGTNASRRAELTPRQREVVQLLAEGKPMKEVACILGVTTRTVEFHKYQVMEERGLRSTASLVQFAIRNHILVQ